jgi:hypothetical protein
MASHRNPVRTGCFSDPPPRADRFGEAGPESSTGFDDASPSDDEGAEEGVSSCNIMNRCSPKAVYLVVSKFSEFKKECVREIGFGGILHVPCITKVNLKLSAWLLSKLDADESSLVFSDSRRLYVHEMDVGKVFGIPCGDLDVGSTEISAEQLEFIREDCGLNSLRSFKSLEHVLARHIDDKSLRLEVHRFKVAFVIFVMGHLLAPSVKHDHGNIDYWGALKDPEIIDRFNWCRYVHCNVLEAAQKVRDELIRKGRVTGIPSCHLFLQVSMSFSHHTCIHPHMTNFVSFTDFAFLVFYAFFAQVFFLDNVEIRHLSKKHDVLPRIKAFDQLYLRRMTESCASRDENDFSNFIGVSMQTTPHVLHPILHSIHFFHWLFVLAIYDSFG